MKQILVVDDLEVIAELIMVKGGETMIVFPAYTLEEARRLFNEK